jgi:hypothetical protein
MESSSQLEGWYFTLRAILFLIALIIAFTLLKYQSIALLSFHLFHRHPSIIRTHSPTANEGPPTISSFDLLPAANH